ncbi:MAG: hypothetical protein ACOCW3_04415 [Spirochaetota bacterium]
MGNEFIALLKDSSLVSILAVADLLRRGREYASQTFECFQAYTVVALIFVLTLFFSKLVAIMEERVRSTTGDKPMSERPTGTIVPRVRIEDAHKSVGEVQALRGVSLEVRSGEVVETGAPSVFFDSPVQEHTRRFLEHILQRARSGRRCAPPYARSCR